MKLLNGSELAGYIKARHARQVRTLKGSKIFPKLAIVQANDDPVIDTYVRLKMRYGDDIGVKVDHHKAAQADLPQLLDMLNNDDSVHGVIVQLPLEDTSKTEEVVNLITPEKDVDALGARSDFIAATPQAIMWLLSGYNIDIAGKKILLVGRGKLVGEPMEKLLRQSGYEPAVIDKPTSKLAEYVSQSDLIITATGQPGLIKPEMLTAGAVVVDAGVATDKGRLIGDLDPAVYDREDLTLTPVKGGVGPLTVCALFENLLQAAAHAED